METYGKYYVIWYTTSKDDENGKMALIVAGSRDRAIREYNNVYPKHKVYACHTIKRVEVER